ncbi:MAG TPA: hypothetical protein VF773_12660 [Verrucomicrobiae bacterium]
MKTTTIIILSTMLLLGLSAILAHAQKEMPINNLMRAKLDHAQSVLEGITMENFELVANHATKLGALSQEAAWRANDTPEYSAHSVSFRRNVEALKKSAREKNLDAATLAYTKMTFSCVECHKYLRLKIANAGKSETTLPVLGRSSDRAIENR